MAQGTTIKKVWRLRNTGTLSWGRSHLTCVGQGDLGAVARAVAIEPRHVSRAARVSNLQQQKTIVLRSDVFIELVNLKNVFIKHVHVALTVSVITKIHITELQQHIVGTLIGAHQRARS